MVDAMHSEEAIVPMKARLRRYLDLTVDILMIFIFMLKGRYGGIQ